MFSMGSVVRHVILACCLTAFSSSVLHNLRPLKGILNDIDGPRNATQNTTDDKFFDDVSNLGEHLPPPISLPGEVAGFFPIGGGGGAMVGSGGFSSSGSSSGFGSSSFSSSGSSSGFGSSGSRFGSSGSRFGSSGSRFGSSGSSFGSSGDLSGSRFSSGVSDSSSGRFPVAPPAVPHAPSAIVRPFVEVSFEEGIAASMQQQQAQSSRPAAEALELSSLFLSAFRRAEKEAEEASCVGRILIETTKEHARRLDLPLEEAVMELTQTEVDEVRCESILHNAGCEDFKKPKPCSPTEIYRRMDGSCNNLDNPTWGKSMTPFVRFHYPAYENGIDTMRGEGRRGITRLPSARTISYNLQSIRENPPLLHISLMVMQWGQFLDHDITFTAETQIKKTKLLRDDIGASTLTKLLTNPNQDELSCPSHSEGENSETVPLECCPNGNPIDDLDLVDCRPIDVTHDPLFKQENRTCMRFVRSLIASKGCRLGPREQLNQITSYIDGSAVYGSSEKVAHVLRKGTGGGLHKTDQGNLLPRNCCEDRTFHCFKAGDTRVNEQPGLTSMHTLWMRVHETVASALASENPHWDDDTIFQESRSIVVALIQQTTYKEFLPLVLGPAIMEEEGLLLDRYGPTLTYDPEVDASVANVIATAAFRFGHTLVNDALRGAGGESVPLVGNFENAKVLFQNNTRPSAILEGLATSNSQAPDFYLVLTLTNKLFAPPQERIGLDLMSLNIQRGRDHGLPPYNAWRSACQLQSFNSFDELSAVMPQPVIDVFKVVYSDVNEIDLFPAALSEEPVGEGLVGPTFGCLLGQQFSRLKSGDRFFFQNLEQPKPFSPEQLNALSSLTLASIICHNSDLEAIQPSVFNSVDLEGNGPRPCSSYPKFDASLWKEGGGPVTSSPIKGGGRVTSPPIKGGGPATSSPITQTHRCRGVGHFLGSNILDHWCTVNCSHLPRFCPPTHCSCDSPL